MPPRVIHHQFVITPPENPSTDTQFSEALELPALSLNAEMSCNMEIADFAGGDAPTVGTSLQGSNDGTNWTGLANLGAADAEVAHTGNGHKWLELDSKATIPVPQVRYLRMRAEGGGTSAPTSWTASATLRIAWES